MKIIESIYENSYFAAANSYEGFISLFGDVFNHESFDKIFILKGGPGTGKSSLMRSLIPFGKENGLDADAIFCSSDPTSLDGVILSKGKNRCAVIDGTAPHSTDPKLPGACEEIINLGIGFNTEILERRRKELSELSKSKSAAYEEGYRTLKSAGKIRSDIASILSKFTDYSKAENICDELLNAFPTAQNNQKHSDIFMSAFGKDGLVRIKDNYKNKITVKGNGYTEFAVMNLLKKRAKERGRLLYSLKYPLYPNDNEGVCLFGHTVIRTVGSADVNTEVILCDIPSYVTALEKIHEELLEIASQHFRSASKYHFEMEAIYVSAMDFSSNDKILTELKKRMMQILSD